MAGENESCQVIKSTFSQWRLNEKPIYAQLPFDEIKKNYVRPNVTNAIFSEVSPTPLQNEARLVCASEDAIVKILDLDPSVIEKEDFIKLVAGQKLPVSSKPVCHRYGGHQFGMWVGQLGDGRVHLIGEVINRANERWELQLKGSGQTPYSRLGDGRCVLRSAIREMIASEACYHLGIPTTRAAALVVSDELVVRDQFYNGQPCSENAAMLLRLSPSWFRIGSLEILARNNELSVLQQLCDFVIREHYPSIPMTDENRYIRFFSEIAHRMLDLVAKWQGFGFSHGVLNTDNISLLGLTLDYGPFGFVDSYDGGYISNNSDGEGRYSLVKQPDVMIWNISHLAGALSPLLNSSQRIHMSHIMKTLDGYCKAKVLETFLTKLGLREERWGDEQLVEKLLEMMQQTGADFTMTFRQMAELDANELLNDNCLVHMWALRRLSSHSSWAIWVESYRERLVKEAAGAHPSLKDSWEDDRRKQMLAVNPRYVPRNWMLHQALTAAQQNNFAFTNFLLEVFKNPYMVQDEAERQGFACQPPTWAYGLKISCSS